MKKQLLLILMALLPMLASAYDVYVGGIYYNLDTNKRKATVTYDNSSYNSYSGSVAIPASITENGVNYSVTSIGDYAFAKSTTLTAVEIPSRVTSIGESAFEGCVNLATINIPEGITVINSSTFSGCSKLEAIKIPSSVTHIYTYAFYDCTGLASVEIPEGVKSLSKSAFGKCTSLTEIVIPSTVTSVNDNAFNGCTNLIQVTINSNRVTKNTETSSSNMDEYFGPQVQKYILGNTVTNIGKYAFAGCSNMTSIEIPNSVTSIGNSAFSFCYGLTSITIPESVTSIDGYAFEYCIGLTDFYCYAENVPTTGSSAFYGSPIESAILRVPASALNSYKTTEPWSGFGTVLAISSGKKGDLNGDDKVDIADAVSVLDLMAEGKEDSAADLNGDGKVDIADFVSVLDLMAAQ